MTHEETTALVRRANASGFDTVADYTVSLEGDVERLRSALQEIAECNLIVSHGGERWIDTAMPMKLARKVLEEAA